MIFHGITLHLSGTPFKALANDKFPESAIFNWTYADEQKAKKEWNGEDENPYKNLPQLNLFTYQMSEIVKEELEQGIEIQGETEKSFDKVTKAIAENEKTITLSVGQLTTGVTIPEWTAVLICPIRLLSICI